MTIHRDLPFECEQLAETKSFQDGFRSAWFRCKIKKFTRRKGQISCAMEYYDFPDEKIRWTQLYQKPPKTSNRQKEVKRELMVRPCFPQVYRENELPDINTISEVVVVVDGIWQVGDPVDWFYEGCFWSGMVTEVLSDDKVKIKLPEKPTGQGGFYIASCKDLRPSLDWSPESGWTVPAPLESQNGRSSARIIQPVKQGPLPKSSVFVANEGEQNVKGTPKSSLEFDESTSSRTSANSLPPLTISMQPVDFLKRSVDVAMKEMQQTHGRNGDLDVGGSAIGKPSCSDSISSTYVRDGTAEVPGTISVEERCPENGSSKKIRVNEAIPLNSTASDSIESAIMDLEELVNRVKWLRQILKAGIPSNSVRPSWKFVEHPAVSMPK